jgi:hypothetical protein
MAQGRNITDGWEDTTLLEIGIPKRRLPKRRPADAEPPVGIQLSLLEDQDIVQTPVSSLYKPKNDFVDARARSSTTTATVDAVHSSSGFINTPSNPPPPPPFVKGSNGHASKPQKAQEEEHQSLYSKFKAQYPADHFDEGKARPVFQKKSITQQVHILERLAVYRDSDRWKDDGGRWIPFASKWLESYDADPPPALKKTSAAKKGFAESVVEEAQRRFNNGTL